MFRRQCLQIFAVLLLIETVRSPCLADSTDRYIENQDQRVEEFKRSIVGRYAHFDVVAYHEKVFLGEMRSLVITYGITEFFLDDRGDLIAKDRFCHAAHKANLPFRSEVPDAFTRAIVPRVAKVDVRVTNDEFSLFRPATPTPIGIKLSEPSTERLPRDPKDPRIADDDNDGKPGVTVKIKIYNLFNTELYIARREIFSYNLKPAQDGVLRGSVTDRSEQLVVGSPLPILRSQRNPDQHPDASLSPIYLIPLSEDISCDELMDKRDELFPTEPEVW